MKLGIAEILKKISEMPTKKARIEELKKYKTDFTMCTILKGALDPNIHWLLPKGDPPPFKRNDLVDQENVLYTQARRMYLFVEGGNPNLKQTRREQLFVELLESLDPADADLVCAMKDKKLPYKGITPAMVREAIPGLLPEEKENEQKQTQP